MAKADDNLGNLVNTAVNTDIVPDTDITHDLGSSTKLWKNIFSNFFLTKSFTGLSGMNYSTVTRLLSLVHHGKNRLQINDQGDTLVDNLNVKFNVVSDVKPDASSTRDLGTSTRTWKNVYTDNIVLKNATVGTGTPTQNKTIAIEVNGETLYFLASTSAS